MNARGPLDELEGSWGLAGEGPKVWRSWLGSRRRDARGTIQDAAQGRSAPPAALSIAELEGEQR